MKDKQAMQYVTLTILREELRGFANEITSTTVKRISESESNLELKFDELHKDTESLIHEAVNEVTNVIAERVGTIEDDISDIKFDVAAMGTKVDNLAFGQARIERKLDATINHLDSLSLTVKAHDKKLRSLRPKLA